MGPRMAMTAKKPMNRDHGRLLQEYEMERDRRMTGRLTRMIHENFWQSLDSRNDVERSVWRTENLSDPASFGRGR